MGPTATVGLGLGGRATCLLVHTADSFLAASSSALKRERERVLPRRRLAVRAPSFRFDSPCVILGLITFAVVTAPYY
jgi:hypothetical protein